MENITQEQLMDLFERAAIYGAFKIGKPNEDRDKEESKNLDTIEFSNCGRIKANFSHFEPSEIFVDDNIVKSSTYVKLKELYRFETIKELIDFVTVEDAKMDEIRKKKQQEKLAKKAKIKEDKEAREYRNYLKLKEKYEGL